MPDLSCRVASLESRVSRIEEHVGVTDEKIKSMGEVLVERRRQTDELISAIHDIQHTVTAIETKLFGYRTTAVTIFRTLSTIGAITVSAVVIIWTLMQAINMLLTKF